MIDDSPSCSLTPANRKDANSCYPGPTRTDTKHAEAEHIWVRLSKDTDSFTLEVEDDGVGFNVGAVDSNYEQLGSLGMVNMRERTELVDGKLLIRSAEGKGTLITVIVPLPRPDLENESVATS